MTNFFGTDGIRGEYGKSLTDGVAYSLGVALMKSIDNSGVVVVGRDTRVSGTELNNALSQGISDNGGAVIGVGVIPTNGVGHFVKKFGADYGVMITASHNPPGDNGLKVFDRYGVKLCQSKQQELSNFMEYIHYKSTSALPKPIEPNIADVYASDVYEALKPNLKGIKVALDCCYGSAYYTAERAFSLAGANVAVYCGFARGNVINVECGATRPGYLLDKLKRNSAQLGFAFDGDADRLAVFENGKFVDNNAVFYCLARYYLENNLLNRGAVVGTVLTNSGLEQSLKTHLGLKLLRSDVGDINIFDTMAAEGVNLGGEESGHYLLSDYATSSDAILNALFLSKIYVEKGSLIEYSSDMTLLPEVKRNYDVTGAQMENVRNSHGIDKLRDTLQSTFPSLRVILRLSGTENKIRLHLEGDVELCEQACKITQRYLEDNF